MDSTARAITTTVTVVATGALMAWFLRKAEAPPEVEGGAVQLRYPRVIRILAKICGVVFLVMAAGLAIAVAIDPADDKLRRVSWLAIPMFAVLGSVTLFETRVHLQADEQGMRGRTAFRGHREIRWDELVIVYYSGGLSTFKLVDRSGNCLRMSRYLRGHQQIVDLLRKLPKRVAGKAIEKYHNAVKAGY